VRICESTWGESGTGCISCCWTFERVRPGGDGVRGEAELAQRRDVKVAGESLDEGDGTGDGFVVGSRAIQNNLADGGIAGKVG